MFSARSSDLKLKAKRSYTEGEEYMIILGIPKLVEDGEWRIPMVDPDTKARFGHVTAWEPEGGDPAATTWDAWLTLDCLGRDVLVGNGLSHIKALHALADAHQRFQAGKNPETFEIVR